ncbi:MAG: ABC transporter ATP-binding protein [Proteobacteria bacterium]|nr:ABC transporter ATP-binding protein [Pseudomonadota bacterium]
MTDTSITIANLSKTYRVYDRPRDRVFEAFGSKTRHHAFPALKDISFEVRKGETLGIVGHNGSGKSTLLQIICGTLPPTSGEVKTVGRISALLELGAGFNPEFTGRENVKLNAAILGLSAKEIAEKFDAIVAFSGIRDHIDQPVKTYSSGMYVRLAFAVAIATEPDILIVDEALSVGDIAFQRKCIARIRELQAKGATVLFVSHSAGTVSEICDRVILLDGGEIVMEGAPANVMPWYHKLMFAPAAKRAAVRAEIKAGGSKKSNTKAPLKEGFDKSLVPESRVIYETNGAEISDVYITTLSGKKVNVLASGKRYKYCYSVRFLEAASAVRFGMFIKTANGVELGGGTSHTEKESVAHVKKGERIRVSFTFTCRLLAGTYFTNAGVNAVKGGERVVLHRMLDAAMFSVLPQAQQKSAGKVDFDIHCTTSKGR